MASEFPVKKCGRSPPPLLAAETPPITWRSPLPIPLRPFASTSFSLPQAMTNG